MNEQLNPSEEVEEISIEERRRLIENNFSSLSDYIRVKSCNMLLPRSYIKFSRGIREFKFREKDIMLFSYPKTGTNWMTEILWAMKNIDQLHMAEEESLCYRIYPLHNDVFRPVKEGDGTNLERNFLAHCPNGKFEDGVMLQLAESEPDRRLLRSHLIPSLHHPYLFNTCKVLLLLRNPKDTCCSFYNFAKIFGECPFKGSFEEFFELFINGLVPFGLYWNHIKEMWPKRGHPNLHIVFYEDLKINLMSEIQKLNNFFEFNLTNNDLERVEEHVSLPNMREREAKVQVLNTVKGSFYGEGKIGSWKNTATPEMNKRMDKWIEEQSQGLDIEFKFQ